MAEPVSLERIGEAVDHLITAPISNWTVLKGLPLAALHASARAKADGPVCLAASRLLLERVKPGDCVLLLTGFIMRDYDRPETDGPIGAAVLGRAMTLALGTTPVAICETQAHSAMLNCFEAVGLVPAELEDLGRGRNRCAVVDFPIDAREAEVRAKQLLDELKPTALIAIERPGAGDDGHYHGGGGFEISEFTAKTDVLFAEAQERGIATIGIGDLGNELGMGVVADEVRWLTRCADLLRSARRLPRGFPPTLPSSPTSRIGVRTGWRLASPPNVEMRRHSTPLPTSSG